MVNNRIISVNPNAAKNLPRIRSQSVRGIVNSSSIVPDFFSSVKAPIVIAGIKKRNRNGISSITVLKFARLTRKRFDTKNHPAINKKTVPTMYADSELK